MYKKMLESVSKCKIALNFRAQSQNERRYLNQKVFHFLLAKTDFYSIMILSNKDSSLSS